MSRVLVYATPMTGHLFPIVPVVEELRRRGHEVPMRCSADGAEMLGRRGIEATPVVEAVERIEPGDWRARTRARAVTLAMRSFCERAAHDGHDLRAAIAAERPDALLVDIAAWGALATAEASGLPWGAWCPMPLPAPSREVPPFGPGLRPARGAAGRMRDRILRGIGAPIADRVVLPLLNPTRRGLGAQPLASLDELFLRPPALLQMSTEPFEYPRRDWPPNAVLVGPCGWDTEAAGAGEIVEPPPGERRPTILVSASSDFQDDARLARVAIEALAEEPFHVVATLPSPRLDGIPRRAGVTVTGYAPHSRLLRGAACAITHGGMGVTQKALALGVPVCAVPFGRDQFEVARRVEVAGAGARLTASRLTASRLRRAVHRALRARQGAEEIARAFAAAGGPSAAADTLEGRVLDAPPRPTFAPP